MSRTSSHLQHVRGFHTTLTTQIHEYHALPSCSLHLLYVLCPQIFIDPYEIVFRSSQYTLGQHFGGVDLELPIVAVPLAKSGILLNVSSSHQNLLRDEPIVIDIPLHLRYGEPSFSKRYHPTEFHGPVVFWACPKNLYLEGNSSLTYMTFQLASFFPKCSVGFIVIPSINASPEVVQVPLGRLEHLRLVETGLLLAIFWASTYLLLALYRTSTRRTSLISKA